MGPNNVIGDGESENRDLGAQARVLYATVNDVLQNSNIAQRHKSRSIPISNDATRRDKQLLLTNFSDPMFT